MKRDRKNRKWQIIVAVMLGICIVMAGVATVQLYQLRKRTEAEIAARQYAQTASEISFQRETIEYRGKSYRRNSYVKAILCMGVDREGSMLETMPHTFAGQADGIFVIAQDTARNTLKILAVPRDTMTEITMTDLNGNVLGKEVQHLTLAYAYGDGREKSCELVKEAVSGLLGDLQIDYYMAANVDVINILNDSVGGVTVTIPSDGMEKRDPAFVKGATVTLHGEQAEAFVRYRDIEETHSAIYRMDRQQEYMIHFFDVVKQKSAIDSNTVPELFELVEDYLVTDMGKGEYLKMALDALETDSLTEDNFYIVPGQAVMTAVYDEFHPNQEALIPVILELFYREVP